MHTQPRAYKHKNTDTHIQTCILYIYQFRQYFLKFKLFVYLVESDKLF